MTNIFTVATYILSREGPMSSMKLQKLCYYCQAWSIAWNGRELFYEDFEAWDTGPVCPELFRHTQDKAKVESCKLAPFSKGSLSAKQKDTINHVLSHYAKHSAQWLEQLTILEDPWFEAKIAQGTHEIITKKSMSNYYSGF